MGACTSATREIPFFSALSTQRLITEQDFMMYKESWGLSLFDVQMGYSTAMKDNLYVGKVHSIDDKMRCFLYAKRILSPEPILREFDLRKIFGNRDDSSAYQRLIRIVETGETATDSSSAFDNFVRKHPQWNEEKSWVLFRDHPLLKNKNAYVERTQLSSLCYMHGSVVMQHLLVSMYTDEKVGMVDISDFLRKHSSAEQLRNHIFINAGGHSVEFLRTLLHLPDHETFEKPDIKSPEIPKLMERYGPGLISSMQIWSCFYDQTRDVHTSQPEGEIIGFHSMVLVGHRKEGNEIRYLLQNWWVSKAFIEVTATYLRACGAIVTFCTTPHRSIPSTFKTNFNTHVESTSDACEYLPLETKKNMHRTCQKRKRIW